MWFILGLVSFPNRLDESPSPVPVASGEADYSRAKTFIRQQLQLLPPGQGSHPRRARWPRSFASQSGRHRQALSDIALFLKSRHIDQRTKPNTALEFSLEAGRDIVFGLRKESGRLTSLGRPRGWSWPATSTQGSSQCWAGRRGWSG